MPRWLALITLALLIGACSDDTNDTTPPGQGGGGGQAGGGPGGGGQGGVGGTAGSGGTCENSLPNEELPPEMLSDTGLYLDTATKELAPYVREFTPQFALWSDDAVKTRWIYLPECDPVIDNSDPDVWKFPVGTRMWKEFRRDDELIETRMIHRWGPGVFDFVMVPYVWDDEDMDATRDEDGASDVKGTEHDVPSESDCTRCHGNGIGPGGTPSRYLGFSAVQLSHAGAGVTMQSLIDDGHLSSPQDPYVVPGTTVDQAALGYLHANCGNCHNETADGLIFPSMPLRLRASDTMVSETDAYENLLDVPVGSIFEGQCEAANGGTCPCNLRIDGQDAANSCVYYRMGQRGTDEMTSGDCNADPGDCMQMPPLATHEVDTAGHDAIAAWIATLP